MILSIIFGVIQIMVGLSLGAYSNLKKKAYVDAYTSHLGWLAIITGIILYVLGSNGTQYFLDCDNRFIDCDYCNRCDCSRNCPIERKQIGAV